MAHLSAIIPDELMVRLKNRLNNLKSTGIRKGDIKKFTIAAITEKLDNTTPKDRGHLILQKEIDELKAENLRLNSAENPDYQVLRTENLELAKEPIPLPPEKIKRTQERIKEIRDAESDIEQEILVYQIRLDDYRKRRVLLQDYLEEHLDIDNSKSPRTP